MQEHDKIELRSDEVQEILTRPPHILVRMGISVICGVIFLGIVATFFFRYPDVIQGTAVITTQNPPVWLVAKTSGKVKELYGKDEDKVRKNALVAVLENTSSTKDVDKLRKGLSECVITDSVLYIPISLLIHSFELGDMQSGYSAFVRAAIEYDNFLFLNQMEQEKKSLHSHISGKRRYSSNVEQQLKLKKREQEIAEANFLREKKLFERGVISQTDLESAEHTFLSIQQSVQQLESMLISDQIEISQLNQSIAKYDIQYLSEKNRLFSVLKSSFQELNSMIENWEQYYVLRSPVNGTLTFHSVWAENHFVQAGDNVFAIVPENAGVVIGRVQIPSSGAGKVKQGQEVNIRVADFPYMEYGLLRGSVKTVSLVPNEEVYAVEVELSNGLITSTGKEIVFRGELLGEAEVITDDLSLAERIISPLKTLLEKYRK